MKHYDYLECMKRQRILTILDQLEPGTHVTAAGWIRTRRDSKGGFSFLELNDGSCMANLQVIADNTLENYDDSIKHLGIGSAIIVKGTLKESPGSKQRVELQAESIEVTGDCPTDYPLQKKRISFERLREIAHLRARTNSFGAVARVRNCLANATHRFFQEQGFLYLNSPIVTASDCEGAGAMFQVTTLDIDNPPRTDDGKIDYSKDFFATRTGLTVSGQLEGETYACALGDVYTFGPTFRAENSNTRRHLAEFWMIEPEMAFADLQDDADLAEAYLRYLFKTVLEEVHTDLEFFDQRIEKGLIEKLTTLADSEFKRLTYTDAITELERADVKFEYPVSWGIDMQSEHERYLTEQVYNGPVTVTDYPKEIKAFYMRMNDDGKTVAAMDVLLPQVGEIIGGSQREERLDILEERMRAQDLEPEEYSWYLDLRRYGSVPHAGFGLGFERIVQFCTGMTNIRDVIPYPRTPRNAAF